MYVHCITKDTSLIETIEEFPEIEKLTSDHAFQTAVHWSNKKIEKSPDIIFCDEFAVNTSIDTKTGEINREKVVLESLKEIRLNLPETRIIILLEKRRQHDEKFIQYLISLAVYDFYFVEQFSVSDLKRIILEEKPRTLRDVADYVSNVEISNDDKGTEEEKESFFKNEEESPSKNYFNFNEKVKKAKSKAEQIFNSLSTAKFNFWVKDESKKDEEIKRYQNYKLEENWELEKKEAEKELNDLENADIELVYYYSSIDGNETLEIVPEIITLSSWEHLLTAINTVVPGAVILDSKIEEIEAKIKYLKRNKKLEGIPIALVGEKEIPGVDLKLDEINNDVVEKLKDIKTRLDFIWKDAECEINKDHLTELYNRRFLDRYLKNLNEKYSVLLCDLDFFKKVNDTYGHSAGDEVLKKFAKYLNMHTRETDLVFRYGGEEFLIIFPLTDKETAKDIAEQLRKGWQSQKVYESTLSGGIAEFPLDGEIYTKVIDQADKALYRSKKIGRNKISIAGEIKKTNTRLFSLKTLNELQTEVYLVAGAAPRVGATGFSLAFAKYLQTKGYDVEIIDAGGGALKWINSRSEIKIRKAPPFSICPGCYTIIDCGNDIPEEVQPLASGIFIVTDLSRKAVTLKKYKNTGAYLVGNRGAPFNALQEIASLWGLNPLCSLPEDQGLKEAEIKGEIFLPKSWNKHFKKII